MCSSPAAEARPVSLGPEEEQEGAPDAWRAPDVAATSAPRCCGSPAGGMSGKRCWRSSAPKKMQHSSVESEDPCQHRYRRHRCIKLPKTSQQ